MKESAGAHLARNLFLSRRREPRVVAPNSVTVRSVSTSGPVVRLLRDVGFRGFAIETAHPIPTRLTGRFEFSSPDGPLFVADAVSVHCHRSFDDSDRWISGWEFPEQPGLDEAMERLIGASAGVLLID